MLDLINWILEEGRDNDDLSAILEKFSEWLAARVCGLGEPALVEDTREYEAEIDAIIAVLDARKEPRKHQHFSVVNFVNMPEIERWPKLGLVGRFAEVEYLIRLIEREPMGVQIGLIEETLPNITFQLFRTAERTLDGLSPFRLGGDLPNIRAGVAADLGRRIGCGSTSSWSKTAVTAH